MVSWVARPFVSVRVGRPNRSRIAILLLLVATGSMAMSTVPRVASAPNGAPSYIGGEGSLLPAALSAPWSERTDYNPSLFSQVQSPGPASGPVTVYLSLWPKDLSLFHARPGAIVDAASFEQRFSPSVNNYGIVESYFESTGWSILHAWPNRMALTIQGPASAVPRAFGTVLESGTWHDHPVLFPTSLPTLPPTIASQVSSISGLAEGFATPTLDSRIITPAAVHSLLSGAQGRTTNFTRPIDTHLIYGLDGLFNYSGSPHWATGAAIAMVLWGDGYAPADLQTFFSQYYPSSFPLPVIQPQPVDGAPMPAASAVNDPSGAPFELTLDMEWAAASAPGAKLYPTYAPDGTNPQTNYAPSSSTLEDALARAISLPNVRAVSMSFGLDEGSDPALQATFETDFSIGASQGISFFAASGDTGGAVRMNNACTSQANPQYPGSSPSVVSVGGTEPILTQTVTGQVTGLDSEPAWSYSGGGFSQSYPAPSWQLVGSANGPISQNGHRGLPDVAAAAAFNFVYFNGRNAAGSGTSFGAPLWAGIVTEMDAVRGTPFGFVTPRLYAVGAAEPGLSGPQGLVDITAGQNCVGTAGTGWDVVTGWGSPRAFFLYAQLTATFVTVRMTANPTSVAPGGSVFVNVTVMNSTSGAPIRNINVVVSLNSLSGYLGPCGGTMSSVTAPTDVRGRANVSLQVSGCFLGSHAAATALVLSNGLFGENSTTVVVNLLGLSGFLALIQYFPYNIIAFAAILLIATVIGIKIGNWRHRKLGSGRRTRMPSPSGSSVRTSSGASRNRLTTAARPIQSSPRPLVGSPEVGGPSDEGGDFGARPVSVPSHVLQPPEAPTPVSPGDAPVLAPFCSNCGAVLPASAARCPTCGSIVA
jgi:kumamolisin